MKMYFTPTLSPGKPAGSGGKGLERMMRTLQMIPLSILFTWLYNQAGGNLGGAGNDFDEEWLPIELASTTQANFELTLELDEKDYNVETLEYEGDPVVRPPQPKPPEPKPRPEPVPVRVETVARGQVQDTVANTKAGTIEAILVENGEPVEFDQPLFSIV